MDINRLLRKVRGDMLDGYPLEYADIIKLCAAIERLLPPDKQRRRAADCPACNGHGCSACQYTGVAECE